MPTLADFVRVSMVAVVHDGLVFINAEIGTTIVLVAIAVGILVVAGTRAKHLIALALGASAAVRLAFQLNVIEDYQLERLTVPRLRAAARGRPLQPQSVGDRGRLGRHVRAGLPARQADEPRLRAGAAHRLHLHGGGGGVRLRGSVFVLALFAILMWRAIRIAYLSKDPFGTYLAAGMAAMFAIQMFVNVGMVIGIMPITGIPLPFLSYGGTAMLVNFIAVGILLNVHMRRFK